MQTERIIAIKKLGKAKCMDIEVDNREHVFFCNGIAVGNSHSYSYSYLTYITAFLKAHKPLDFYCSWLNHSKNKQKPLDEVSALIYDAKKNGYRIEAPCILHKNRNFKLINNRIIFGLSHIKDVGDKDCDKILKTFKDVDFKQCGYLCVLMKLLNIKKTAAKRLLGVGALDYLNKSREQMLFDFELLLKLTKKEIEYINTTLNIREYSSVIDLFSKILELGSGKGKCLSNKTREQNIRSLVSLAQNKPSSNIDDIKTISAWEKSFLGISLTCSKLDILNKVKTNINCYEFDFMQNDYNTQIAILAEILTYRDFLDKNDQEMAFISIADAYNKVEGVIFGSVWPSIKSLIQNNETLIFYGIKNQDTFIINNVEVPKEK
jgi:DNA polymerase III alpha subunit